MARGPGVIVGVVFVAVTASLTAFTGTTAVAATARSTASQQPSPYATKGCLVLDKQPGSRNYLNSEVEPQVAIDPTDPSHLVGAWQQDRWSNGGAHGLVAGYSTWIHRPGSRGALTRLDDLAAGRGVGDRPVCPALPLQVWVWPRGGGRGSGGCGWS